MVKAAKFVYNRPDDYKIVFTNGVYGGISPRGDIVCNFFFEHNMLPEKEEFELTEGKLGKKLEEPSDTVPFERDLKVGIILKVDDAEAIAQWLSDKVKQLRGEKPE